MQYRGWRGRERVKSRDRRRAGGEGRRFALFLAWLNWKLTCHSIANRFYGAREGERAEGGGGLPRVRARGGVYYVISGTHLVSQSRADVPRVTGAATDASVPSVRP